MEETSQQYKSDIEKTSEDDPKPSSSHVNFNINITGMAGQGAGLPPRHKRSPSQDNQPASGTNDYIQSNTMNNLSVLSGDNSLSSPQVTKTPITIVTNEKIKT